MTIGGIPENTLVVVTTGTDARFFRTEGRGNAMTLRSDGHLQPAKLDDDGPAGKRPPESSLQETDEATFAKQLAEKLYKDAHQNNFKNLILISDPGTLGQIRNSLHKTVQEKVLDQIPKTLIHATVDNIVAAIRH